jgi:hypothetical protein
MILYLIYGFCRVVCDPFSGNECWDTYKFFQTKYVDIVYYVIYISLFLHKNIPKVLLFQWLQTDCHFFVILIRILDKQKSCVKLTLNKQESCVKWILDKQEFCVKWILCKMNPGKTGILCKNKPWINKNSV